MVGFLFSIRLSRLHANLLVPPCGQDSRSAAFASFAGRHPGAAFPAPELSSLLRSSLVLTRTFATPVALLLFCPVVAMLHPLHSPLASGANPFALFLGAGKWRFFEAYSPASGFITGTFSDAIPKPLIFLSNSLLCFFQPDKKPCLPLKLITFRISSCII